MEPTVTDSPDAARKPAGGGASEPGLLFTTAFADLGVDATLMTPWSARSASARVRRP